MVPTPLQAKGRRSSLRTDSPPSGSVHRKLCCRRLSSRARVILGFLFLLGALLLLLLLLFLYVIPKGIEGAYASGFKYENVRVSQWTFFPDKEHFLTATVEGVHVHPKSFWGYEGTLDTLECLNDKNQRMFHTLSLQEKAVPGTPLKRSFKFNFQIVHNATNKFKSSFEILDAFAPSARNVTSPKLFKKIKLTGAFGLWKHAQVFPSISFFKPFSEFQMAIQGHSRALARKREHGMAGFQMHEIHLNLKEVGVRLEMKYSTSNFKHSYRLPKGVYPIFVGKIPAMLLQADMGINLQHTSRYEAMNMELHFLKKLPTSGNLLFSTLYYIFQTGELGLTLKGPALENHGAAWTTETIDTSKSLGFELPSFLEQLNQLKECFAQANLKIQTMLIQGSHIESTMRVRFPHKLSLETLSMDFGVKFKVKLAKVNIVEIAVRHVSMTTKASELQVLQFTLHVYFSQDAEVIQTLFHFYQSLSDENTQVHLSINQIQFFPTESSGIAANECMWCESLFSEVEKGPPLTAQSLKKTFEDAAQFIQDRAEQYSGFLKVSNLRISNRERPSHFVLQARLDMAPLGLDMGELRLPSTRIQINYKAANLAHVSLPKGLLYQSRLKSQVYLEMVMHLNNDPKMQSVYNHFLEAILEQQGMDAAIKFTGLTMGEDELSLRMFEPYEFTMLVTKLYHRIRKYTQVENLDNGMNLLITPISLHVDIINSRRFGISMDLQVHPPFPFSLDLASISFKVQEIQLHLPPLKVNEGDVLVPIEKLSIHGTSDALFSKPILLPSRLTEMKFNLPANMLLTSLRFGASEGEKTAGDSLDSFSQFQVRLVALETDLFGRWFDVSKLKMLVDEIVLESITLDNIVVSTNSIVLEGTLEYVSTDKLSINVDIASFDFYFNGMRQKHVDVFASHSRNGKHQLLQLRVHMQFDRGESAEAEKCEKLQVEEAPFCVRVLSMRQNVERNKSAPITFLFSEPALFNALDFIQKSMGPVKFNMSQELNLSTMALELLDLVIQQRPKSPHATPPSDAQSFSENAFGFHTRLTLPWTAEFLRDFSSEFVLSTGMEPLLNIKLDILDYHVMDDACSFRLLTEIQFLDISGVGIFDESHANHGLRRMKRRTPEAERNNTNLFQAILSRPLSFKVVQGKAQGLFGLFLEAFIGLDITIPNFWYDLIEIHVWKDKFYALLENQHKNALGRVSKLRIDISTTRAFVDGNINPVIGMDGHAALSSPNLNDFQFDVNIPNVLLDIFVNNDRIGVLTLLHPIQYNPGLDTELNVSLGYYAESRLESKVALEHLMDSLLSGTQTSVLVSFKHLRLSSQQPTHVSLLDALYYSISAQDLKVFVDEHALKRNGTKSGEPYSKRQEVPLSVEAQLHSMAFYFETNFHLDMGILFETLIWKEGQLHVHGVKVSVDHKGHTPPHVERSPFMDQELQIFNVRIGDGEEFPSPDGKNVIDAFTSIRCLHTGLLAPTHPLRDRKPLLDFFDRFMLDKLDLHQDLENGFILILVSRMLYSQASNICMPKVKAQVVLKPNILVHVENSPVSNARENYDAMEIAAKVQRVDTSTLCKGKVFSEGIAGKEAICFASLDIIKCTPDARPVLVDGVKEMGLYVNAEMKKKVYTFIKNYAHTLKRTLAVPSESTMVIDAPMPEFSSIPEQRLDNKSMFQVQLRLSRLMDLNVEFKSVRFEVTNTIELKDKQSIEYTVELKRLAVATKRSMTIYFQAFVSHAMQGTQKTLPQISAVDLVHAVSEFGLTINIELEELAFTFETMPWVGMEKIGSTQESEFLNHLTHHLRHLKAIKDAFLTSPFDLHDPTIEFVGTAPSIDLKAKMKFPPFVSDQISKFVFYFRVQIQNFFLTLNQTKVQPCLFQFDSQQGMSFHVVTDIPKDPDTGYLPRLPKGLQRLFPTIVTDLLFPQDESDDPLKKENEYEVPTHLSIVLQLNDVYFGSPHPMPINRYFTLPLDLRSSTIENMIPDFSSIEWGLLHLNFTEDYAAFHFCGKIKSKFHILSNQHGLNVSVSHHADPLGNVACQQFHMVGGEFSGIVYISIAPGATFSRFSDLNSHLSGFNVHELRLYSRHATGKHSRVLLTDRYFLPLSRYVDAKTLETMQPYFYSSSQLTFPYFLPISIEIPYLHFIIQAGKFSGRAEIEHIQIHHNQRLICITSDAADYFFRAAREISIFAVFSSGITSLHITDIRFGFNRASLLVLKELSFNADVTFWNGVTTYFSNPFRPGYSNVCRKTDIDVQLKSLSSP